MSELDVIVAALAAGAAAGTSNTATQAVQDMYQSLKGLLRKRLRGQEEVKLLSEEETDEAWWRRELGAALSESGAAEDDDVARYARLILANNQGVQVGIHTHQVNYFGSPPPPAS